jgi:cell division protein ZapA (FtsZ GTPase activity inhibitor)
MEGAKQKVNVSIIDQEFSLISSEPESYVHQVAGIVDAEVRAVKSANPGLSAVAAALLAATNLTDRLLRSQENAENMRTQLKDYLEEVTRAKYELAETRRELNKLRKEK